MWPTINIESVGVLLDPICSADCEHCFYKMVNFGGWRGFKYPNTNIRKLYSLLNQLSEVAEPAPLKVFFFGGETLNHFPFIVKFIQEMPNRQNFSFCLTSNGFALDKAMIDKLNRFNVHVNFSYDRFHAEKLNYDLNTYWMETVALLDDVRINRCLSPRDDISEVLALGDRILSNHKGKLDMIVSPIIFKGDSLYDLERLKDGCQTLMSAYRQGGLAANKIVNLIRTIYRENYELYGKDSSKVCPCGPYPCSFYVDANLDIYSCIFQPQKLGDQFLPMNFIISKSVGICDRSLKCSQCDLKFICLGGCHGVMSEHMCEVMNIYYNPILEGLSC